MAAGFDLSQSVSLEQVQKHPQREELLLPVDAYFSTYPALTVEASAEKKIRNGMTLVTPQLTPGQYRVYGTNGAFLALCRAEQGKLITVKSFFEV